MAAFRTNSLESNESATDNNINPLMARYKFDVSGDLLEEYYLKALENNLSDQLLRRAKIFLSTALHNIQYSPTTLEYFSKKIAKDMKKLEAENMNSISFEVEIEPIKSDVLNPKPLKIAVRSVDTKNKKKPSTTVYVGIFCPWKMEGTADRNFLNLPFLFCFNSKKYFNLLHGLFEKYFGCTIRPLVFSQHEFRWLMTIIVEKVEESSKNIELIYEMDNIDLKVNFLLSFSSLKDIWDDIHDENRSEIRYEEVVRLHGAFEEHIKETYGFDLSHFHLKRFSLPDHINIDVSGKVHISTTEILNLLLRFLNENDPFLSVVNP